MIKTLSFATFAAAIAISLITFYDPSSPLLWFASASSGVLIARLLLAALVVLLAMYLPTNSYVRASLGIFGAGLIIASSFGFLSSAFMRAALPLDLIFGIEVGIILCLAALSAVPEQETGERVFGRYRLESPSEEPLALNGRLSRKA
jgi:hypothetical protein